LLDEIRLRGESSELRDEVAQLARRYAIVTPYTSYLIVEDEARRGVPVAQRSLQTLERDGAAKAILREGYDGFRNEKAGSIGALNARAAGEMKNAAVADSPVTLDAFSVAAASAAPASRSFGSVGAPAPAEAKQRIDSAQQAARNIAGKTFFQNGAQWIDSELQRAKPSKNIRVQFASSDYFKLIAEKPAAAQWLALGSNVQFTLGDTLYEIFE
jgi:Ca-activated chloride channel family protein